MCRIACRPALLALAGLLGLAGLVAGCTPASAPGISARMVLSSRTVPAGAQLAARVIVDNRSGHAPSSRRGLGHPVLKSRGAAEAFPGPEASGGRMARRPVNRTRP